MTLTYQEALGTLTSMFGEPWTEEALDAVLRHHGGHMENTVETVLSHGDGDPEELVERLAGASSVGPLAGSSASAAAPAGDFAGNGEGTGGGQRAARGTPADLPRDFLRIPGYDGAVGVGGASSSATSAADLEADAQLAKMLQDEMFTRQLRDDPEYVMAGGYPGGRRRPGGGGQVGQGQGQGADVVAKLTDMGEKAKSRLTILAKQFNDKVRDQRAVAGMGMAGGGGESAGGGGRRGGGGPGDWVTSTAAATAAARPSASEQRGLLDLDLEEEEEDFSYGGAARL